MKKLITGMIGIVTLAACTAPVDTPKLPSEVKPPAAVPVTIVIKNGDVTRTYTRPPEAQTGVYLSTYAHYFVVGEAIEIVTGDVMIDCATGSFQYENAPVSMIKNERALLCDEALKHLSNYTLSR